MGQANAIMVHVGADASAHINQLRLELENAEMNAKQEALAVGYANDQTCALHIEMLEIGESEPNDEEHYVIEHQAAGNGA